MAPLPDFEDETVVPCPVCDGEGLVVLEAERSTVHRGIVCWLCQGLGAVRKEVFKRWADAGRPRTIPPIFVPTKPPPPKSPPPKRR
jgi:hypothetical protein